MLSSNDIIIQFSYKLIKNICIKHQGIVNITTCLDTVKRESSAIICQFTCAVHRLTVVFMAMALKKFTVH